jgi:CDP-diglyceride synthetase
LKKPMKLGLRLLRDVGIALAVVAAIALLVSILVYTGHTELPELPVGWLGLAGFTPVVFWAVIKPLRMYWKHPSFWLAVAALLVLHFLAFVVALLHYPRWPLLWFVPISVVEAGLLALILGKLFSLHHGSDKP